MLKPRIAVFSPAPPVASGIGQYCVRWLDLLSDDIDAHLFLDGYEPEADIAAHIHQAAGFEELHAARPFDLAVYQIGNAACHDYIFPFLYRHPGLLVLHDAWLMGRRLMRAVENWEGDVFRAEMTAAYGERGESAAEIILTGLHNNHFLRYFPMVELPVRASRLTVTHEPWLAESVSRAAPDAQVRAAPHLLVRPPEDPDARERVRGGLGVKDDQCLIGSFGLLTPEKGIAPLLSAFAWVREREKEARLLLCGGVGEDLPLDRLIKESGAADAVILPGRLDDDDFFGHMAACDVVVQLRWPTRRETSGVMIAAMRNALPVVASDLAHLRDYPADALVRIPVTSVGEDFSPPGSYSFPGNIRDQERVLRRALLDLVQCPPLRRRIGRAASDHVERHHADAVLRRRWLELIDEAIHLSDPDRSLLPAHMRS